jgi:hexosaminidase
MPLASRLIEFEQTEARENKPFAPLAIGVQISGGEPNRKDLTMISTCLISCTLALALTAIDVNSSASDLLPRPQEIQAGEGACKIDPAAIWLNVSCPDSQTADRLASAARQELDEIGFRLRPDAIRRGEVSGKAAPLVLTLGKGEHSPGGPKPEVTTDSPQGYGLAVTSDGIVLAALTEVGLYNGIQTLTQLLNAMLVRKQNAIPCLTIRDWPALQMRGFSEDYGRNQLPTVEDHKREIRFLSQFKMNTYLWFIEPDHFVYKFDPTIGQDYDRFTFGEVRELVAFAKDYHIEIIPTVELLGHMEMLLRHPKYRSLAEVEGDSDLCPTSNEPFDLVRKIIGEVAPAFESKHFHCGLDESFQIGKGKSAQAVKDKGLERVIADYYIRMNDLVKSHGKTMMMYADIVLAHPKIIDLLPKDIVMMFWDYTPRERYEGFDRLAKAGFPLTSLSTLWDWGCLYPVYNPAIRNMDRLALQSKELDAVGHFVSSWGDPFAGAGGTNRVAAGTNLSELNTYGVAYCGAVSWNGKPIAVAEFSRTFALQFYGLDSPELAGVLTRLAECQGDRSGYVRTFFYTEILPTARRLAKADDKEEPFWQGVKQAADNAVRDLPSIKPPRNADYLNSLLLSARMVQFTADFALLCRSMGKKLGTPDLEVKDFADRFDALATRQQGLWKDYQKAYLTTNRPINVKYIAPAWDYMRGQLTSTAAQLREGKVR